MERKEFRKCVKDFFKSKGYSQQKSTMYKIFDDDYLIGIHSDPSSYCKGYRIISFAIFLPDDTLFPLCGFGEVRKNFLFPIQPGDEIDYNRTYNVLPPEITTTFEYEKYTTDQLMHYLDANYSASVTQLMDKNYGLEYYRNDWRHFGNFWNDEHRIKKICQRAGIEPQDVLDYLEWYYNQGGRFRRTAPEDQKYFRELFNTLTPQEYLEWYRNQKSGSEKTEYSPHQSSKSTE